MRRSLATLTALAATVTLAACGGDSKEEKASNQVCDARADIAKQVDTLSKLTLGTATSDQVQKSLKAIGDDLTQIKNAQGDLSDERKQQVQKANQDFEAQVKDIVSTIGRSTSATDAAAQLESAMKQIAGAYKDTFAKVDCD